MAQFTTRTPLTRRLCALSFIAAACAAGPGAWAQNAADYPSRAVKIIAPTPPGQSTDILARLVADQLSRSLGQSFYVDNKPGAGNILGTDAGAKAPPDGYTLVMAVSGGVSVAPAIYAKMPYDPQKDLAPITNLGTVSQTLVTASSAPWHNVQELIAAARKTPMNYGSAGVGSTSHLTTEAFLHAAGITATHVPFKGAAESQPQLIGGQIQFMFDALPAVVGQVRAGKMRVLGVGSAQRTPFLPDAPTIAEQGFPNFSATGWIGISAPAKTPVAILDKLNTEIRRIMATPEMRSKLQSLYFTPAEGSREEFAAFIAADIARWGAVAKAASIKPE